MSYQEIERPPITRRKLADMDWHVELEAALLSTIITGKAVSVPLWQFHSSPAKGRLYSKGFRVRHRVLADHHTVAAWIEAPREDHQSVPSELADA